MPCKQLPPPSRFRDQPLPREGGILHLPEKLSVKSIKKYTESPWHEQGLNKTQFPKTHFSRPSEKQASSRQMQTGPLFRHKQLFCAGQAGSPGCEGKPLGILPRQQAAKWHSGVMLGHAGGPSKWCWGLMGGQR